MSSRMRDRKTFANNASGGGFKRKIVRVVSRAVPVRETHTKYATITCSLKQGVYIQILEEVELDGVDWVRFVSGWICSKDNTGFLCYQVVNEAEAGKAWALEYDNRRRIAYAICAEVIRSHSLTNARRVIRALVRAVTGKSSLIQEDNSLKDSLDARSIASGDTDSVSASVKSNNKDDLSAISKKNEAGVGSQPLHKRISLVNLPDVSMEDLIVSLSATIGLRQAELLDFIRIAASQQSNPTKALVDIVKELETLMSMRPTLWIKNGFSVLETSDMRSKNDRFIMAAATNSIRKFDIFLAKGQELAAVHSDLGYTALHAAADFGALDTLKRLLKAGITPNIRDIKRGGTPLHFAAMSGRVEIVKILLDAGADRDIANYNGQVPFQVAADQGHVECREILKAPPLPVPIVTITGATARSIQLKWEEPLVDPAIHAKITEFMIEWTPIGNPLEVGNGDRFFPGYTYSYEKTDLLPATGHNFMIYVKSLAGWSAPSSKLTYFTLPDRPSTPPPVEIFRITNNGLLFSCLPPKRDNGSRVAMYEVEVIDYKTQQEMNKKKEIVSDEKEDVTENSDSNVIQVLNKTSNVDPKYRLLKLKKMDRLWKQCMGLEPLRPYVLRARCKNESGWSNYSNWQGPIAPQAGVYILEKNGPLGMIRIGWFKPIIAPPRKVTKYEVQFCNVNGPMSKNVAVMAKENGEEVGDTTSMQFKTLRDDLTINELEITNLKPGNKYVARVRVQIDGIWNDWDVSLMSDVISMPAQLPDAPFDVKIALSLEYQRLLELQLKPETESSDDSMNTKDKAAENIDHIKYDVQHDSIVINWINGNNNGLPAIEYQVDVAKVREYRCNDLMLASSSIPIKTFVDAEGDEYLPEDSKLLGILNELPWVNSTGNLLGPQAFHCKDLTPGCSYVFRVRQRTQLGWSPYSKFSNIVSTFPALPPSKPEILKMTAFHALIQWQESKDERLSLSNLEYDVQIGKLPFIKDVPLREIEAKLYSEDATVDDVDDWNAKVNMYVVWVNADVRKIENMNIDIDSHDMLATMKNVHISDDVVNKTNDEDESDYYVEKPVLRPPSYKSVMIDKLSSATTYVCRVRVRTVAGWSTWSKVSHSFTTLSV
jgi:hypothetical protein